MPEVGGLGMNERTGLIFLAVRVAEVVRAEVNRYFERMGD